MFESAESICQVDLPMPINIPRGRPMLVDSWTFLRGRFLRGFVDGFFVFRFVFIGDFLSTGESMFGSV